MTDRRTCPGRACASRPAVESASMIALPRAAHSGWMGLSCFGAALSAYSSCGAAAATVADERMRPWPSLHSQGRCGWCRAAHAWRTLRCHNALITQTTLS